MKILRTVQEHYAIVGFSQSTSTEQVNKRILIGLLLFGYPSVSQILYIFHVADGFIEYVQSVCTTVASTIIFVCFVSFIRRKTQFFEIIDNLEKLIDTSEPRLDHTYRFYRLEFN